MRITAIFFMIASVVAMIVLPIVLILSYNLGLNNIVNLMVEVFHEAYFTVLPGFFILGVAFFFRDKISIKEKKGGFHYSDGVWIGLIVLTVALFIWAYTAPVHSIINRVPSIIPPLGYLAPDLYTFILWITFFVFVTSFYFIYRGADRLKLGVVHMGSFYIALSISMGAAVAIQKVPAVKFMEETFISLRYAWLRDPGRKEHTSGLPYCQPPVDVTGKQLTARAPNPPGVREDIEIIGISNKTIEQVKGNWPLDWNIYANLVHKVHKADNSIMLFDISFLDEKGIYGGNYCGVLFECEPIGDQPLRSQVNVLADAINNAENTVISDYPVETTDESRSAIVRYNERLELLREKSALRHVKNGRFADIWAKMPLPPALSIEKVLDGMGYANVLKDDRGYNRWIPLVVRIKNESRARQPGYNPDQHDHFYPSIDLQLAAKYYGVDPIEDIEVDWLDGYVKIKNIPAKSYQKLNRETFQMETFDIMAIPNDAREIVIPINRRGQMDINFRGGRYCFRYNELLETSRMDPEQAAGYFKDKILLIAMYYATGVGTAKDTHLAPYGDMAGIEHHAYGINTILNQDFTENASPLVNFLILMIVGIIMALYQSRVGTWMNFILLTVLAMLIIIVSLFFTFDLYSYLHVFPSVIIEQVLIFVTFIGFRVLTEEENVKFIRNTFSKFVSQDVVEELLANPDAITLGGSKKEVSVFFSDVRGFTTISEALGPEELVQLLNEYLTEMTELIIEYRGTIDKYMGDAIMAFWGAPTKNDDHAYYACVAAIAQYMALQELQKRWSERNIPVLDIGIGINSGQAVVGNMGSSRRMDYTLMGDTVNLGSRLEGVTKTYGVKACISEFTYERVKDRVYARELDLVRVKGKLEPVRIYELMGLRDDSDIEKLKRSAHGS